MAGVPWNVVLAALGVAVPVAAVLYDFFTGRRQLGYRVQLDTAEDPGAGHAGVLRELSGLDGRPLTEPSFVLLRIENSGMTPVGVDDYAGFPGDRVGLRVHFPGRRVTGMMVSEFSNGFLRDFFRAYPSTSRGGGDLELPRVPLNRSDYYKVLVALERVNGKRPGREAPPAPPQVFGGLDGRGGIKESRGRDGRRPRRAGALIWFLVLVLLGQLAVSAGDGGAAPEWGGITAAVAAVLAGSVLLAGAVWLLLTAARPPGPVHGAAVVPYAGGRPDPVPLLRRLRRLERWHPVWLAAAAALAYLVAYVAARPVLDSMEHDRFGPSETAQVITAIGALGSAIGLSVAAVIKSVALLMHARADMMRARAGLPPAPAEEQATADQGAPGPES